MTSSFTNGTTAVIPRVVDGYKASRQSRHAFHPVLSGNEDVYARPAGPRSGTMTAVFDGYASAAQLSTMLAGTTPVSFADSDRPELGMTFLADGDITLEQSPGRSAWIITVAFREVTP